MTATTARKPRPRDYALHHRSRANLLIHLVAVPLFLAGNVGILITLANGTLLLGAVSLVAVTVSLWAQGRGHRLERTPPVPYIGSGDAVRRTLVEEWYAFPKFVFTGGWARALRAAGQPGPDARPPARADQGR